MFKSQEELEKYWFDLANKALKGRKIVAVRYLTTEEAEHMGWYSRCVVMQLDDGTLVFPSTDDEGNNAGALFTSNKEAETLPVLGVKSSFKE